jgi:hypothetical protein
VGGWPGASLPAGQAGGRNKVIVLAQTGAIIDLLFYALSHSQTVLPQHSFVPGSYKSLER